MEKVLIFKNFGLRKKVRPNMRKKVSRVSVKRTPDARVSDPIVLAVNKWVFRPAQLNGQPVAVKILLGIPL